ncbi:glutamate racemase [Candidatus Saccharibacteria bacterium]|nr:glutamate racemase [Candidatus Saccharibacteria bacterium]
MKKSDPICIFDSGIGGSYVLAHLGSLAPNESYYYYSDSRNCPYGEKEEAEVCKICDEIVQKLLKKHPRCIIIACNTASSMAASFLREKYPDVKIFAIEPAYKLVGESPALVMATPGTLSGEKFQKLFKKYDNGKTYLLPCPGLASLIEDGAPVNSIIKYLKTHLAEYRGKVEKVVLGCTHYALIKNEIESILGPVEFIDGAPYLAENVVRYLEENGLKNTGGKTTVSFTDSSTNKDEVIAKTNRFYYIFKK